MTRRVVDRDFVLHVGDALEVLRELPADAIDCAITSPPYWGLRDYGVDGQLGSEATPELFVDALVDVFAEVRRVLAPHGTLWLNLGDTYATSGGYDNGSNGLAAAAERADGRPRALSGARAHRTPLERPARPGLKRKDLAGVPWRTALALQAAGWYLRADVIWSKPNPMPSSVLDRPTTAHEYVFLLTKRRHYYYDAFALREAAVYGRDLGVLRTRRRANADELETIERRRDAGVDSRTAGSGYRNARSVWEIPTQSHADAHFAVYPEELVRRCLVAGCPELVCRQCGKPRERIVERTPFYDHETTAPAPLELVRDAGGSRHDVGGEHDVRHGVLVDTVEAGWTDCGHDDYRRGVVLDPFLGSGTTAAVARRHSRNVVGIELSAEYAELAATRTAQLSLESELEPTDELELEQLELVREGAL